MSMSNEGYITTQHQVALLAGLVQDLDLDGFLDRINSAESIVPITNPTLFMKGAGKLGQIKKLAQALQPFKEEAHEVAGELLEELAKEADPDGT